MVFVEFPTIYFNKMDSLIATARSNKVATTLAMQDFRQLKKDYGKEQADVIVDITGNLISGQVMGETSKLLSERFGKIMQDRQSVSVNRTDTSISHSKQLDSAIPASKIAALSSGEFVGLVADNPDEKIKLKMFNAEIINDADKFNNENKILKKGISLMPICFGISFTKTMMNQARALVHIYTDGSISISTGAVEMGQGVNTKMLQVAQEIFKVDANKITVHSTNTFRIANTSPSAASATADLNGKAVEMACQSILQRLLPLAAEILQTESNKINFKKEGMYIDETPGQLKWERLSLTAYIRRISLSEHAYYATPDLTYDASVEKGHPFAYHVFGTAITVVTVDCLRGIYEFDAVKIVHDFGSSMNTLVDRGQIEGGLVQGMGWMTMEELVYDEEGRLRSNALSTLKLPVIYSGPKNVDIEFLET